MHEEVAEVRQDPFSGLVAFHAVGHVSCGLELGSHLIGDGLALFRVVARADHEVVSEGGYALQVQNLDIFCLF